MYAKKSLESIFVLAGLGKIKSKSKLDKLYFNANLEAQKRQLIRMMILESYLQIDAKIGILITNFFFSHCNNNYEIMQKITSSEQFKAFQDKILYEMPFLRKVSILKSFTTVPKVISSDIYKINDLRNAIAHALIPELLGQERITYKGESIFSVRGAKTFDGDVAKVMEFLQAHFEEAFAKNN